MQPVDKFDTVVRKDWPETKTHLSQLLGNPDKLEAYWDDTKILAQYDCAPGYLVMYDDQAPFENSPHAMLFDRALKLLDECHIVPCYPVIGVTTETTDITASDDTLAFTAYNQTWRLVVLSRPRWCLRSMFNLALFLPTIRRRWFVLHPAFV